MPGHCRDRNPDSIVIVVDNQNDQSLDWSEEEARRKCIACVEACSQYPRQNSHCRKDIGAHSDTRDIVEGMVARMGLMLRMEIVGTVYAVNPAMACDEHHDGH